MPAPDDVTIGELGRTVAELRRTMADGFLDLRSQIQSLAYVHTDVYTVEINTLKDRLAQVENRSTWYARAFVGSIFTTIGGAVLLFISTRGGV